MTITGTNLAGTSGVTFGGTAATSVVVVNGTTVTCTTPAKAAGAVNVVLTTPGGTATSGYTYNDILALVITPTLSSGKFDGTGDYLAVPSEGFDFGTGDFTIDTRVRLSEQVPDGAHMVLYSQYDSAENDIFVSLYKNPNTGTIFPHVVGNKNGVNFNTNADFGTNLLVNTWYHIEISRENGVISFFLDGIKKPINQGTNPGIDLTFAGEVQIGAVISVFNLNGYLDEFRISKGIARHNASFTPPATLYTADAYTELLLHFDGEEASTVITDSSAAARPVTARGDAKISRSVYPLLYLPVNEGGSNSNMTVRLNAQPAGNIAVTVSRTAGDADLNVSSGTSLTFTPANWSLPQTVTISAAQDADHTNGTATFTVASTGLASQTVLAMEVDDDLALVITPTLSSGKFDGTGDYLAIPSEGFDFGTGDFTIDTRVRLSEQVPDGAHMVLYSQYDSADNDIFVSLYKNPNTGTIFPHAVGNKNGVNFNTNADFGTNLLVNTWYHIEISRENGVISFFLDGIKKPISASINPGIDITFAGEVQIGAVISVFNLNGYLDEFRISKGIARHNASFTPPATLYTADAYTELLLHFDGEEASTVITDSSAAARPVTARGDAKISRSVYPLLYLPVNEGGSNSNMTVRLNAQPAGNIAVTVSRTAGDADLNVSSGTSLTFTPANWSLPQTVTISAAQDADHTNGTATFTVASTGLASQTVLAMEVEDDVAPLVKAKNDFDGDGKTDIAVWRPGSGTGIFGALRMDP